MPLSQEMIKEDIKILKRESQYMRESIAQKQEEMNNLHNEIEKEKRTLKNIETTYCAFEYQLKD